MRRATTFGSILFGTCTILFIVFFNSGDFGVGQIAGCFAGATLIAASVVSMRTGRFEYLVAMWGIHVGTALSSLIALSSSVEAKQAGGSSAYAVVITILIACLSFLSMTLISAHTKAEGGR